MEAGWVGESAPEAAAPAVNAPVLENKVAAAPSLTSEADVMGPLAIGAAALLGGLSLLFFGTRGVIRRRGSLES